MSNGDPQKPNYNRLMFDTISQSPLRGGISGPISTQQELTDPLDIGIAPFQDVDTRRGQFQGGWQQFGNALIQTAAEVTGGTIEGLGYLGEIGNIGDIVNGTEQEFGNALSEFGQSIKESSREAFPIYTDFKPGSFAPGNFSWWMTNAPSIASTLSLMIPSGMATGAVTNLVKATGMLGKGAKMGKNATAVTQALFSRHMENMMEASQSFDEIYNKNIQNGLTVEDAKKNAAIAASSIYKKDWAMLAQDILQYRFLGMGTKGMRAAGDDIGKGMVVAGKTIIPAKAKPTLRFISNMGEEGVEEGYQFVVQKEGEYLAQRALDPTIENEFGERMGEYIKDGDLWTSAFFGALGAGAMQSIRGINQKLTKTRVEGKEISSWGAETSRAMKTSLLAQELNNTSIITGNKDVSLANMMTKASVNQGLGRFKTFVEDVVKEDVSDERLAELGISREEANEMAKNSEEILGDINRYEQIFNDNIEKLNNEEYVSPQHSAMASRAEFLIEKLTARRQESEATISDLEGKVANFDKLSPEGKQIKYLQAENKSMRGMAKYLIKLSKEDEESSKSESYRTAAKNYTEQIVENNATIKDLKETRDPETAKKDDKLRVTSKAIDDLQKEITNKVSLDATIEDLQDSLEKLQNGEMPFDSEPDIDTWDDVEPDSAIPQVDDGVVYTNPKTNEQITAQVKKIENGSEYIIQPFDHNTGEPYGEPFKVASENLERVTDSTNTTDPNIEPADLSGIFKEDRSGIAGKQTLNPNRSIQWYVPSKPEVNVAFNKFISNPNLNQIDLDTATIEFIVNPKLVKGVSLDTKVQDTYDKDPVDTIPIQIKLTIAGKSFNDLYVHRTNFGKSHNPKVAIRETRRNILKIAQTGVTPTTQGITLSKGHYNNTGNPGQNIPEAWKQSVENIKLGIVDQDAVLNFGSGDLRYEVTADKGMLLAETDKTITGETAFVRVNPAKLSKEHANLLWDALVNTYRNGYTSDLKSDKVEGLTSGDVLRLLAFTGERQTSVDAAENSLPDYMRSKQLYVKKDEQGHTMLYFGMNPNSESGTAPHSMPFLNTKLAKDMKSDFVAWAIENKNYPTYIFDKQLGISGINAPWGKKFKLGKLEYNGTGKYSDFLMENGLVTTDVVEFVEGTIFEGPVVEFNEDGLEAKSEKKPKAGKKQSKDVKKPIKEEDIKEEVVGPYPISKMPNGNLKVEISDNIVMTYDGIRGLPKIKTFIENLAKSISGKRIYSIQLTPEASGPFARATEDIANRYNDFIHLIDNIGRGGNTILNVSEKGLIEQLIEQGSSKKEAKDLYDLAIQINKNVGTGTPLVYKVPLQKKESKLDQKDKPTSNTDAIVPASMRGKKKILREAQENKKIIKQDIKRELRAVRQMLGKRVSGNVQEVNKIIDVAKQGKKAWATYRHDMITLFNGAETGSIYHEAFHRVSLGYLTPEEREGIHEEAKREYGLRGLFTVEIDDELAERFRIFVLSKGERTYTQRIAASFSRILAHIRAFFTGSNRLTSPEVDRLFNAIYDGKYAASKVRPDAYKIDGEVLRQMYGHEFDQLETVDQLRDTIKGLTHNLLYLNKISDLNEKVEALDWSLLRDDMVEIVRNLEGQILENPTDELKTRLLYYTDLLGYDKTTDRYEGFEVMKELITSFLSSMNIQVRVSEDPDNITDSTEEGLALAIPDKQSFEISVKENSLGTVKLNVALLGNGEINPITGMYEFVNYNETWNSLLGDLYQYNNIQDMVVKINELKEVRPGYAELYETLEYNKDNLFQNQFLATMRKHKHAFMDAVIRFEEGTLSYEFKDADIKSVSRQKVAEWGQHFRLSESVDRTLKVPNIKPEFKKEIKAKYEALRKKVTTSYKGEDFLQHLDGYYEESLRILAHLNINVDGATIDNIVGGKDKPTNEAFVEFITKDLGLVINNVIVGYNPKSKSLSRLYEDSAVNNFGDSYARAHPEQITAMVLGPGAAQYYVYANHSVVSSLIRDIKLNPQEAEKLLNSRFNMRSRYLNQLAYDETIRNKVRVRTFGGITRLDVGDEGRDYLAMTPEEDYSLKLHAVAQGLISFPTLSDKKTYYFLDGFEVLEVDYTNGEVSEDTVDAFYNHVRDEYDRITKARQDRKNMPKEKMVETYHHVNGDIKRGQAYDFMLFNGLKYDQFDETVVKEQLRAMLNAHIQLELDKAVKMGIISLDNGVYKSERLDSGLVKRNTEKYGNQDAAIRAIFAENVVRTLDNNIELHKMFIGDPAFYQGPVDLSKRLGAIIAAGEEMALQTDQWGADLTKPNFNVATLKTQKLKSAYYGQLKEAFMSVKGLTEKESEKILKPYLNIEQADGQAFVTPAMYRSIAIRIGEWSKQKEAAYKLLISDKDLSLEEESSALGVVLNPLKTVYFGYDSEGDIAIPIYDKMSMAPLFRRIVKGKDIEHVLNVMENKGIDMLKMDSATKVGNRGAIPLFKDKEQTEMNSLEDIPVFVQQFKNLRRQQVTPVHDTERTNVGTQMIKIGMGDLNMTEQVYSFEGKKTGREISNIINSGLGQLSKNGKEEVDQEFGYKDGKLDKKKMVAKMRKEARAANMPLSTIEAIKEENGRFYLEMDSMPNRKWFFSRMISSVSKKVINRKLPGGQFIQVSNLGFRNTDTDVSYTLENRLEWLQSKKDIPFIHIEDGKVVPMGTVVSINAFKHAIPNYDKKTWQEKVDYVKKQKLDVIGYRIPTQGQNSIVVMKVVGILPEQAGDAIILPSEFTALTGSDFDIDKLFLIRKNYTIKEGNMQEIDFITNDDEKAYNRMLMHKFRLYKGDLSDEFKNWYIGNNYDRIETIDDEIDIEIEETKQRLEEATSEDKPRLEEVLSILYQERDDIREERDIYTFTLRGLSKEQSTTLRDRITKELVRGGYLPKIDDFKELSNNEKNIPKAIENRVINAYMSILTSEEHLLKIAAPLGGLTDDLKSLAGKVRAKTEVDSGLMLDYLTPRSQSETKFKYASGKAGIGPFALHNAHHIITQLVEYKLVGGISNMQNFVKTRSKLEGNPEISVLDLSANKGADNVNILDWLSALIDAHVDMAKDPYIMDLNVNPFTYDIISYLIRTGVGKQGFVLLSNPAIKLASDIFINSRKSVYTRNPMSWTDAVNEAMQRFANGLRIDNLKDEGAQKMISERKELILSKGLENKWFEDNTSSDYQWNQLAILDFLKDIRIDSQLLTNDVQSTQVDTKRYGSSIIGLEAFFNKIRKSIEQSDEGKTYGYKSIIPYDEETIVSTKERPNEVFIADYYRNGLVHMVEMFSNITLDTTPIFRDGVKTILALTNNRNTIDERVIDRAANELYSALYGHFYFTDQMGMTTPLVRGFLKGENSVFSRYDTLSAKYPDLFETNSFLNRLITYRDESSIVKDYFALRDTEHKDPMEIDDIVYSWEELLAHSDPEINKLARHIYMYLYYTTGFNQKIYGFTKLVPPSFNKELKVGDKVYNLDATTKGLLSSLQSDSIYPIMGNILNDILSHNHMIPRINDILRPQESNEFRSFDTKEGTVYTHDSQSFKVGVTIDGHYIAIPYIRKDDRVYKYEGYIKKDDWLVPRFVYTEVDQRGHFKQGRFVHEYGLTEPLFTAQRKSSPSAIPSNMAENVTERFNGAVWNPVDIKDSMFDFILDKDTELKSEEPIPSGHSETKVNTLSSPSKLIEIFVDGSDIKAENKLGYGAWLEYNGSPYGLSGASIEVSEIQKEFPGVKLSNPTMEMLGLSAVLRKFADTGEHLVIRQDYSGAVNYGPLWARSEGSLQRATNPWKAKEEYIKWIVDRIGKDLAQIEGNGGSVRVEWVPGHITPAIRQKYPEVFPDDVTYEQLKKGNNNADQAAKSTTSKDTVGDLLGLRVEVKPKIDYTGVTKVISGGQTGVDRLGLDIAKELNIETGGTATPGFKIEGGKQDLTLKELGLIEPTAEIQARAKTPREFYLPRTEQNVLNSDGTVYFIDKPWKASGGLPATRRYAAIHSKPFIVNPTTEELKKWLSSNNIVILNVAGSRASTLSEGMAKKARQTMTKAFSEVADVQLSLDFIKEEGKDIMNNCKGTD